MKINQDTIELVLKNYTQLLKRIDAHIQRVEKEYSDKIVCKKGCDSCCRFLSLFPVEAFALSAAFLRLDKSTQDLVRDILAQTDLARNNQIPSDLSPSNLYPSDLDPERPVPSELEKTEACPLLINKECILYEARPIICRTHGFPIYIEKDGKSLVDFCPKNFKDVTSFSKDALLSLGHLNTLLTAINTQFLKSIEPDTPFPDRIPISQALFMLNPTEPS